MEAKDYFQDKTDSDIGGIVIVETDGSDAKVTENRENGWCAPFWMKGTHFNVQVKKRSERVGKVNDEQFEQIVNMARQNI